MGTFRPELVWVEIGEYDKVRKKMNQFVKKYPYWFVKSNVLTNSTINYVMFWDGSKEGWDTSNKADKLRKKFIEIALKAMSGSGIFIDLITNQKWKCLKE